MTFLTDWYVGDAALLALAEVLAAITVLISLTWAADAVLARRRAALSSALWHAALVGVLLAPALPFLGRALPWHVGVLPADVTDIAPASEVAAGQPVTAEHRSQEIVQPPPQRPS